MGGRRRTDSSGHFASLVRLKETAEDALGLPRNLGDLRRAPCRAQRTVPLRLPDPRLETTLMNDAAVEDSRGQGLNRRSSIGVHHD